MRCTLTNRTRFCDCVPSIIRPPDFLRSTGYQNPCDPRAGAMQYTLNMDIDIWEWLAKNPEANARFNTFMEGMRGSRPHWTDWFPVQERVLDGVDDRTRPLLVDIGGGRGHDIACFAERFPNTPGQLILEELPAVIDDIATLDPRIQRMKHNFFYTSACQR